jgi:hypothetical protein
VLPHALHTTLPGASGAAGGEPTSYSGDVDHPWKVVMSKRRRCLSDEPETT